MDDPSATPEPANHWHLNCGTRCQMKATVLHAPVARVRRGAPAARAACRALLCLTFLASALETRIATACSCYANPPCAAVWRADAVFIGIAVEKTRERVGGSLHWIVHRIAVSQVLRGSVDSFVTMVPSARPTADDIAASRLASGELEMMSSCDYDFQLGGQYLIYARRTPEGRLATSECSGTKPIEEAAADLDYIASIPSAEPTGRVYGHIERTVADPSDRTTPKAVPAAGVAVALTGATSRLTVTTDPQGKLDVQVPPGDYTIAPVVPETIRVYGAPHRASVPARGCAPVYFSLITNGRIEGRVVREDGTGVPRVSVEVIPAESPEDPPIDDSTIAPSATTDQTGRFAVDAILAGRYYIAANARYGPRLDSPYVATYLPGVARRAEAQVVDLGEGERKTGFTIVVSPLAETTVSGLVTFDDDRPVTDAGVQAQTLDRRRANLDIARTDASGRFRLRVLAGMTYVIRAAVLTPGGLQQTETVVFVDRAKEDVRLVIGR